MFLNIVFVIVNDSICFHWFDTSFTIHWTRQQFNDHLCWVLILVQIKYCDIQISNHMINCVGYNFIELIYISDFKLCFMKCVWIAWANFINISVCLITCVNYITPSSLSLDVNGTPDCLLNLISFTLMNYTYWSFKKS
jgi:hypothetical protein